MASSHFRSGGDGTSRGGTPLSASGERQKAREGPHWGLLEAAAGTAAGGAAPLPPGAGPPPRAAGGAAPSAAGALAAPSAGGRSVTAGEATVPPARAAFTRGQTDIRMSAPRKPTTAIPRSQGTWDSA